MKNNKTKVDISNIIDNIFVNEPPLTGSYITSNYHAWDNIASSWGGDIYVNYFRTLISDLDDKIKDINEFFNKYQKRIIVSRYYEDSDKSIVINIRSWDSGDHLRKFYAHDNEESNKQLLEYMVDYISGFTVDPEKLMFYIEMLNSKK